MEIIQVVSYLILWLIVIFNLILTFRLIRRSNIIQEEEAFGLKPGSKAPRFSGTNLAGITVTNDDFKDLQVAFLFINPHCQTCKETITNYLQVHNDVERGGARMTLVSLGDWIETRALAEEFKLDNSVVVAPINENLFGKEYKCIATPSYCIIDGASQTVLASGAPIWEMGDLKMFVDRWIRDSDEPLTTLSFGARR